MDSDVLALARWLLNLSRGRTSKELGFVEPNLSFECLEVGPESARVRVWFELEARPSWAPHDGAGMQDLWLDLELSSASLTQAAQELRAELDEIQSR